MRTEIWLIPFFAGTYKLKLQKTTMKAKNLVDFFTLSSEKYLDPINGVKNDDEEFVRLNITPVFSTSDCNSKILNQEAVMRRMMRLDPDADVIVCGIQRSLEPEKEEVIRFYFNKIQPVELTAKSREWVEVLKLLVERPQLYQHVAKMFFGKVDLTGQDLSTLFNDAINKNSINNERQKLGAMQSKQKHRKGRQPQSKEGPMVDDGQELAEGKRNWKEQAVSQYDALWSQAVAELGENIPSLRDLYDLAQSAHASEAFQSRFNGLLGVLYDRWPSQQEGVSDLVWGLRKRAQQDGFEEEIELKKESEA